MALSFASVSGWLGTSGQGCSTVLFTPYEVLGAFVAMAFAGAFTPPPVAFDEVLVRVMKSQNPIAAVMKVRGLIC